MSELDPLMRIRAVRISAELLDLTADARSLEEGAGRIVGKLYDDMAAGNPSEQLAVLVRIFVLAPYSALPKDLRSIAESSSLGQMLLSTTPCLTLLATRGDRPEWNDRRQSREHQCIPLGSDEVLGQLPMISRLMQQFGVHGTGLFQSETGLRFTGTSDIYDIFHVEDAAGSPFIPAQQEFVKPFKIRSVIGFGAPMVRGWIYAGIVFSKVTISERSATSFRTIALSAKLAFAGLRDKPAFSEPLGASSSAAAR